MTITQTVTQKAALAKESIDRVTGIMLDVDTPLYYCDGLEPVTLDSDLYTPRELAVTAIRLDSPANAQATVSITDLDGTLGTIWLTERLTGITVTITEAVWHEGAWVITRVLPWYCDGAKRTPKGTMELTLRGGAGLGQKAGLEVATRARWRFAPEPGQSARIGATIIQV